MDLKASKTYCLAPWTSLYVQHDGDVFPCCHWTRFQALGNLKTASFEQIWNSERTKKLRIDLKNGKSPNECEDCRFYDRIGAQSLRTDYLRDQNEFIDRVDETKADGSFEKMDLLSLSIAVGTQCQLRCRTCGPSDSSSWEALVSGSKTPLTKRTLEHLDELQKTIDSSPSLNRVLFVGGEPIIHENHYKILNSLLDKSRRIQPRLFYNTNLFQLRWKDYRITDYWNQFSDVTALISIDGSHDRFDFIRTGHSWKLLLKNLATLREDAPHVKLKAYVTVSLYNFLYLPETIEDLISEAGFSPEQIHFNIVRIPLNMNIRNSPENIKNQARVKYVQCMKKLLIHFDQKIVAKLVFGLQSVMSFFSEEKPNAAEFSSFLDFNRTQAMPEKAPAFQDAFQELASDSQA